MKVTWELWASDDTVCFFPKTSAEDPKIRELFTTNGEGEPWEIHALEDDAARAIALEAYHSE